MPKNMSFIDRLVRVVLAVTVIVLFVSGYISGTFGAILIALSVVFLATSLISYCPLYSAFGIRKWEKKTENKA